MINISKNFIETNMIRIASNTSTQVNNYMVYNNKTVETSIH